MRKIIVATFTSLDGVMQAPGGPQEDPTAASRLAAGPPPTSTRRSALPWVKSSAGPSTCCLAARPTTSSRRTGPDEFGVLIFAVVLGKGKRLFGDGAVPAGLKLVKSQSYLTGVIMANYEPDGEVKTGDFQLAEPSKAELERRRNLT